MIRQYGATVLDNSSIDIGILADEMYKVISEKEVIKESEEER